MRGNEAHSPALSLLVEEFQIPMRGNERYLDEEDAGDVQFQIPMRGNEAVLAPGGGLRPKRFKSP